MHDFAEPRSTGGRSRSSQNVQLEEEVDSENNTLTECSVSERSYAPSECRPLYKSENGGNSQSGRASVINATSKRKKNPKYRIQWSPEEVSKVSKQNNPKHSIAFSALMPSLFYV